VNIIWSLALIIGLFSFVITVFRDIGITMIFNFDAFLIVVGGTTVALLIGFPLERTRNTIQDVINAYSKRGDRDALIGSIIEVSRMWRKSNIRDLEGRIQHIDNDFLGLGIKLLINNYEDREIIHIMRREMRDRMIRYSFSRNLLKTVARLTPSFGLAGTVISLIKMFRHLESIDSLAPVMAVALMSTFYGVIIANLFMMPLCAKLKEGSIEAEGLMAITIEGILAVKAMEHPLKIEERLKGCREELLPWPGQVPDRIPAPNVTGSL
jgi:chemotaxis protein MotA